MPAIFPEPDGRGEHGGVTGPDLLESARAPGVGAGDTARGRRRSTFGRRLLWVVAAVATAVVVGAVVTEGGTTRAQDSTASPLARRGPSHPTVRLESVPGGWLVVGRLDGFGAQVREERVRWPDGAEVALLVRCPGAPALVRVNFAGSEPVAATPCTPGGTLVSRATMPALEMTGGAPVTVRAANETFGSGAWVVAVLTRVPFSPWSGSS
jgi:hypothetical protein